MAIKPINRELALAIDTGDGAAVLATLEAGADPNTSVGGQDMLYRSWKNRRHQVFQVLMENGARMQGKRKHREGLYLARAGWLSLLGMAVQRGWPMDVETPEAISERRTVAGELVRQGNREGLLMLDSLGLDIRKGEMDRVRTPGRWRCTLAMAITENTNTREDRLENLLDVLLAHPPRDNDDCQDVGQALQTWISSRNKSDNQVDRVLQAMRQSSWWTPDTVRQMATRMAWHGHTPEWVMDLANEMPSIIDPSMPQDTMGSSLLMSSLHGIRSAGCKNQRGMLKLIKGLLAMGADSNHRHHGQTMVHCLMLGEGKRSDMDFKVLDALVNAGAKLTDLLEAPAEEAQLGFMEPASKRWHGCTMAHVLAWMTPITFSDAPLDGAAYLKQLIEREPALLGMKDQSGMTPLHSAVLPRSAFVVMANKRMCRATMEMMLDHGADPLARWKDGNHLLHAISIAWKQGLKPKDGDLCLDLIRQRAPELWSMANEEGMTGQEALDAITARSAPGPIRKR